MWVALREKYEPTAETETETGNELVSTAAAVAAGVSGWFGFGRSRLPSSGSTPATPKAKAPARSAASSISSPFAAASFIGSLFGGGGAEEEPIAAPAAAAAAAADGGGEGRAANRKSNGSASVKGGKRETNTNPSAVETLHDEIVVVKRNLRALQVSLNHHIFGAAYIYLSLPVYLLSFRLFVHSFSLIRSSKMRNSDLCTPSKWTRYV
jgi:hypothetical protein